MNPNIFIPIISLATTVYALSDLIELNYIAKHDPISADQESKIQNAVQTLRRECTFTGDLAANILDCYIQNNTKQETPLSHSLRKYHNVAEQSSGLKRLVLELTSFPTFNGFVKSIYSFKN